MASNEIFQFFAGVLLWRGFSIDECINQCFGNKKDAGKGKQMPIHYGSKDHYYVTVSSPLGTQLPQGKFQCLIFAKPNSIFIPFSILSNNLEASNKIPEKVSITAHMPQHHSQMRQALSSSFQLTVSSVM